MWASPLLWVQIGLLAIILIIAPIYAIYAPRFRTSTEQPKALNLPKGSVRAMLALLIVGSYAYVLVLGQFMEDGLFDKVLAAFGTLAGAVTGFYFAGRGTDQNIVQNGEK